MEREAALTDRVGCRVASSGPEALRADCRVASSAPAVRHADCRVTSSDPAVLRGDCRVTSSALAVRHAGCRAASSAPEARHVGCRGRCHSAPKGAVPPQEAQSARFRMHALSSSLLPEVQRELSLFILCRTKRICTECLGRTGGFCPKSMRDLRRIAHC